MSLDSFPSQPESKTPSESLMRSEASDLNDMPVEFSLRAALLPDYFRFFNFISAQIKKLNEESGFNATFFLWNSEYTNTS